MAALKVYGNPLSAATMRVLACLYRKGLKCYINRPINAPIGEENSLFGEVAALEDGSSKIYGSRAITNYLAHKYADQGRKLIPSDGAKMAAMFELMDLEVRRFDPVVLRLACETRMKPLMEMESCCEPDVVEKHKKQVERVLDLYEERINKLEYFPDKREKNSIITLADVNHMPLFHYLRNTPSLKELVDDDDKRPAVNRWCKFILGSAAWGKVTDTHIQSNN